MPTYRAKLVEGAYDQAQEHDTGVSIFESKERYEQRVDDDGYVDLRKREFDRLYQLGLIEDSITDPAAETPDPADDETNTRTRTVIPRGNEKVTAVSVGGVGHQPNDNYSNQRVQDELNREQERGAALQKERGLPTVREATPDESLRSDHHLPEQIREHEKATREHEQAVEKAQREGAKEREKAREEQAKQDEKDRQESQKERERRARETETGEEVNPVNPVDDSDTSKGQGQDLVEAQNEPARNQGSGESKAEEKDQDKQRRGRTGAVQDDGEDKSKSRAGRDAKVKDALKADDKNDDKPRS